MKIIIGILLILAAGCKRTELMKYEGTDGLYFSLVPTNALPSTDSAQVSFGTRPGVTLDSVILYIKLLGNLAANDRPFTLQADQSLSTAIAGVHYELPAADSFFIAAGAEKRKLVIKISKPADLYDAVVRLNLRLVPNEHFGTDMKVVNYAGTSQVKADQFRIIISDQLQKPPVWEASENYLGTYSRKKIDLMVSVLGLSLARFYGTGGYSVTQLNNFSRQLQLYLNKQKGLGNIIYEADGTEMKMGPAAQ